MGTCKKAKTSANAVARQVHFNYYRYLMHRIKQCEFAQKGLKFDIPRTLMVNECAVRALFTDYDNYSHHSVSFAPRLKAAPGL